MAVLFPGQYKSLGFESVVLSDVTAVALTVPSTARMALVQCMGNPVNWRDDSVNPTAGIGGGMIVDLMAEPITFIGNMRTAKFISTNASGSTLLVSFYG